MPIQIADAYRYSAFAQRQTGLLFNLPVPDPAREQLPAGISLCMIVKNEERFLAECLESVKDVVDEINIIDTGSTDRTVEIARSYGANIDFREWRNDFAWARNEALALATRRWTLVLDADEELERESAALLRSLRSTPAGTAAVYINIVNTIDDSAGAGTMSHRLIRLFPTTPALRYAGVIHESIAPTDGSEFLGVLSPITILHKGYTVELLKAKEKDTRNRPLLAQAYADNGADLFSMFNFGNSEIMSGNAAGGVEILERMLATAVTPKLYFPIAYLMLAQTYSDAFGDDEKALERIDQANAKFPNDAGIYFTKGQILAKLGRVDEARAIYDEALGMREMMAFSVMTDEEVFEWKIYYALAGTYEREHDWTSAIGFIDKALANKPNSFHLQKTRAAFLERGERYFEAEQGFRNLVDLEPQRGKIELVNYLLRRGRHAQVLALVEDEVDIGLSADTIAQLNLSAAQAVLATQSGDPVPFLESALRHAPGNGPVLRLMELVLTERGSAETLARFHRDELLAPLLRPEDFARRSYRLLALEQNEDARLSAEHGLALDPNNAELRFNSALASFRLGDESRAANDFGRVESRAPDIYAKAMQLRAGLLLKSGDNAGAVTAIERGLAAQPPSAEAVLRSARALIQAGARAGGRSVLETYVAVDPSVALELASIMLHDGDVSGAGRIAAAGLT